MAEQIKVESRVIRSVSGTLQTEAGKLFSQYEAMQQEVAGFARRMRGTTIETAEKQFTAMRPTFEKIRQDIQNYSQFLSQAAEEYERAERDGTAAAGQQGRIF
jgi:WXG100 family type VII secretion target